MARRNIYPKQICGRDVNLKMEHPISLTISILSEPNILMAALSFEVRKITKMIPCTGAHVYVLRHTRESE